MIVASFMRSYENYCRPFDILLPLVGFFKDYELIELDKIIELRLGLGNLKTNASDLLKGYKINTKKNDR